MVSFSVIVPVRNGARYIEAALASALSQMNADDELLVQDGASSDSTVTVVQALAESDQRISIVSQEDDGQTDALKQALQRARCRYVVWLNADDLLAPGALHAIRTRAVGNPSLIYGGFSIIDEKEHLIRELYPAPLSRGRLIARGCYVFSGSCFFRRDVLESLGFNEHLHYCMDLDLLLRFCEVASFQSICVPVNLAFFRLHAESKTGGMALKFVREAYSVRTAAWTRAGRSYRRLVKDLLIPTSRHIIEVGSTNVRYSEFYSRIRGRRHRIG